MVDRAVDGVEVDPCVITAMGVGAEFFICIEPYLDAGGNAGRVPVRVHLQHRINADVIAVHLDHGLPPYAAAHLRRYTSSDTQVYSSSSASG